jgi:hypothetical protein
VRKVILVALLAFAAQRIGVYFYGPAGSNGTLQPTDFTYQGALRMPASGVATASSYGGFSGRQVSGNTHLFILGSTPSGGGIAPEPVAYEIDVTGLTPSMTPGSAPQATLVTNWGNIFGGKLLAFNSSDSSSIDCSNLSCYPTGLYWDASTSHLNWAFTVGYTENSWTSIGFATLDNPVGPVTTKYGPFFTTATTQQTTTNAQKRGIFAKVFIANPPTGKMWMAAASKSGNAALPTGPSAFEGVFPTTSDTQGIGGTAIPLSEYLNYYFGDTINAAGGFTPPLRSFLFTNTTQTYVNEPGIAVLRIDPAQNSGIGNWGDETSSVTGGIRIVGAHKSGMVYFAKSAVSAVTSSANCTVGTGAAHEFYRNAGQGSLLLASTSGFTGSGTLTGGTSGTTATTTFGPSGGYIQYTNAGAHFTVGETVTQSGSGASSTVVTQWQHDNCSHGCTLPVAVTGPGSTVEQPLMIIYPLATLDAVHANSVTDYEQTASSITSLKDYGAVFACDRYNQAGTPSGVYMTGSTLYIMANDWPTATCSDNTTAALIHVFTVDDSPAPHPFPLAIPWASAGLALTLLWPRRMGVS